MDDFGALEPISDEKDADHEASLITLISHHRKRAFTEANIGSDPEGAISNPWWSATEAQITKEQPLRRQIEENLFEDSQVSDKD